MDWLDKIEEKYRKTNAGSYGEAFGFTRGEIHRLIAEVRRLRKIEKAISETRSVPHKCRYCNKPITLAEYECAKCNKLLEQGKLKRKCGNCGSTDIRETLIAFICRNCCVGNYKPSFFEKTNKKKKKTTRKKKEG